MIYTLEILTAIFVMATGFAASWAGLELVRWAGWREPAMGRISGGPVRVAAELALAAMIGPRLLLANGFRNWRNGMVSLPLFAVLALVAAGWSMCSGVLVLQMAFASGFFLA
ncbi:MAG: hypothetical protein KUA43_02045 [Hoeflea sp.]|uniref:DUF6949 family protein n=1 Tax=Hoeflea sp. TaxID=1940281 RepID=UPI001DAA84EA|nr:hypothetical protein [Hoeflea sp.]MBU4530655.1 hypothetical protein [Alphaproteobacteria bacterium]MBU4544875.1 hypothetical protein [Alphaproteobacteria bacterium]MBU4552018.1 hypothetical protein [Alphaproteobacteria bacterium]MBV1722207.1 hypothetical protein [Hoeflea sp.]MBV1761769.1 hypothetical protein [Hoeflea sp.]